MAKGKNRDLLTPEESHRMIGDKLSFAAAEAYKLLRTNLNFSLPDEGGCKVIGVTSALRGEGKSTTSVNIAYTMAQTGKRVLLLEADLRLPTIAKRLKIEPKPGISNLLVGQCTGNEVVQESGLLRNLRVITAGDVPPNPAELLGSRQMESVIRAMSGVFDVIIVDLPPVNIVSDALIVSNLLNGMVVVVRQNYCSQGDLAEVVRQLEFAKSKILGFVMTGSDIQQKSYKRYGNYRRDKTYGYGKRPKEETSKK